MSENKGPFTTDSEDPLNQEICDAANDMATGGDGPTPGEIMAWRFAKEGDLCPHCKGFGSKSKETSRPCPLCKGTCQKGKTGSTDEETVGSAEHLSGALDRAAVWTRTGRFSAKLPNLANQPQKSTELKPSDRDEEPTRDWPALRDMDRETLLAFREDQELFGIDSGLSDEELRDEIRFALEP